MPRKKKTIVEETIPDGVSSGIDDVSGSGADTSIMWDTEEDELLARIKSQYGGSLVKVKVYKITPGKSQPVFCFSSEENVDEEQLQETYGGGKYALRFFVENTLKHTAYLEVADKPANKQSANGSAESIQNQMLREQSQWNRDLLLTILGRPSPVNTPTPMNDIAQMWTMIQGNQAKSDNFQAMITLFTKGLELGAGKSGDMDWKTALIQTVREIAPGITNAVVSAQTGAGGNGGNGLPNNMSPALIPDQMLRQGISMLKTRIIAGLPVGLALDWIVTNASDPQYQPFLSAALSKSFEDLVKVDNELANEPYNSWFREFLIGLKDHFKEAGTVEQEPDEYDSAGERKS